MISCICSEGFERWLLRRPAGVTLLEKSLVGALVPPEHMTLSVVLVGQLAPGPGRVVFPELPGWIRFVLPTGLPPSGLNPVPLFSIVQVLGRSVWCVSRLSYKNGLIDRWVWFRALNLVFLDQ